jgi:hypothetical protein
MGLSGDTFTENKKRLKTKTKDSFRDYVKIGDSTYQKFSEVNLYLWQITWLKCLRLLGPAKDNKMLIGGNPENIDGRLWAYLRILYASTEESLVMHGYNPFTLNDSGSFTSMQLESHVVKTMIGICLVTLQRFGTQVEQDILSLMSDELGNNNNNNDDDEESTIGSGVEDNMITDGGSLDIQSPKEIDYSDAESIEENHRVLRRIIQSLDSSSEGEGIVGKNENMEFELNLSGIDLEGEGAHLSYNKKQIMLYRIRKKKAIKGLVKKLSQLYFQLRTQDESITDLLFVKSNSNDNQSQRTEKLKKLVEEVSQQESKDYHQSILDNASTISVDYDNNEL